MQVGRLLDDCTFYVPALQCCTQSVLKHAMYQAASVKLLRVCLCADAASSIQQSYPQPGEASVSACDFQWCGGGIGEQDVMYLLWSSLDPAVVVEQEQKLLRCTFGFDTHALIRRKPCVIAVASAF